MAYPPLVSIVIRSTDRQVFLAQALKSIEAQSYSHIEVILVAACAAHSEVPGHVGAFPLRFIDSPCNVSRSDAANIGLKHCQGAYVLLLDDDDFIFPKHIEKLVSAMLELAPSHQDLVAVFTDYEVVDAELRNPRPSGSPKYDALKLLCGNFMTINTVLFSRHVLDLGCAFDPSLDVFEDWDFWIQLSQHGIFKKIEGVSAYYRIHNSSGVHEIQAFWSQEHQLIYQKWFFGSDRANFLKLVEFSWKSFVQIDQQIDEVRQLQVQNMKDKAELTVARQQMDHLLLKARQQHDQLLLDFEKLQLLYTYILQSRSWLITRPLRQSTYFLKRLLAFLLKLPTLFKPQWLWEKCKTLVDRHLLSWLMRFSSKEYYLLSWLVRLGSKRPLLAKMSTLGWIKRYKKADHHSLAPYKIYKALSEPTEHQSVALLVTYAPNGLISGTTLYYLQQLRQTSIHVVLCVHVDDDQLDFKSSDNLMVADAILVRKNIGFDFALWASALSVFPQLWQARQIIFTNDSILGPFATFDPLVHSLNQHPADFIALTDSHQLRYHAQSFFFVLQNQALKNAVVRSFWGQVLSFQTKQDVINAYELNLWEVMTSHAQLQADILFKTLDLKSLADPSTSLNFNPTHQKWQELIAKGFPFIKSELLQKNPTEMPIANWDQFIKPYCKNDDLVSLMQDHIAYLKATKVR